MDAVIEIAEGGVPLKSYFIPGSDFATVNPSEGN